MYISDLNSRELPIIRPSSLIATIENSQYAEVMMTLLSYLTVQILTIFTSQESKPERNLNEFKNYGNLIV